jgi:hypothetical protein
MSSLVPRSLAGSSFVLPEQAQQGYLGNFGGNPIQGIQVEKWLPVPKYVETHPYDKPRRDGQADIGK